MNETQVRTADEVMRMILDGEIRNAKAARKGGKAYSTMVGGAIASTDAKAALDVLVALREKFQDGLRLAGLAPRRAKRPTDKAQGDQQAEPDSTQA